MGSRCPMGPQQLRPDVMRYAVYRGEYTESESDLLVGGNEKFKFNVDILQNGGLLSSEYVNGLGRNLRGQEGRSSFRLFGWQLAAAPGPLRWLRNRSNWRRRKSGGAFSPARNRASLPTRFQKEGQLGRVGAASAEGERCERSPGKGVLCSRGIRNPRRARALAAAGGAKQHSRGTGSQAMERPQETTRMF
ncbi:Protein of unknown function [Gryllus bimaculatus]|nr:Protein of unknown function [Gryllus bimaculatus]